MFDMTTVTTTEVINRSSREQLFPLHWLITAAWNTDKQHLTFLLRPQENHSRLDHIFCFNVQLRVQSEWGRQYSLSLTVVCWQIGGGFRDLLTLTSQIPKSINNPVWQTAVCHSGLISKCLMQKIQKRLFLDLQTHTTHIHYTMLMKPIYTMQISDLHAKIAFKVCLDSDT